MATDAIALGRPRQSKASGNPLPEGTATTEDPQKLILFEIAFLDKITKASLIS
ncbi:hypothetical protein [Nonomuraea polychroma]|uniref:hypothetical protein n=1 Tax=Nonomuraea polychroma TaxID=46176 RepID=UPI0013E3E8E3|nr:hypothetical protein [Nonomuraea polychroma]